MELRQIRYFQRVAAELSFTRAAKALHMAQPPLSRQIKMLEEEIGVSLFERAGRGIRLTDAGRYFLDQTDLMMRKLSETVQATQRIGRQEKRRFGVGFVPSVLYGYMPAFIRRLRMLDPNVEISLAEMITLQQFEALKTGRIDIGIGRILLTDPEIERLVLWDERLIAAVPRESGLASRSSLTVEHILSETLILYPARPRPSYADHVLDIFQRKGAAPERVKEVNELQTAVGLVAAGVGIAIVPESVQGLFRDEVVYVPIGEPGFSSPIMLSWRKNDQSEFLRATLALAHGVRPHPGSDPVMP
ncbi:LysR family transcriptional regulator [Alcaligenaceae bacterium]|nr:LysR family transcriptional regulator [Alcaligenaceae bacterium]